MEIRQNLTHARNYAPPGTDRHGAKSGRGDFLEKPMIDAVYAVFQRMTSPWMVGWVAGYVLLTTGEPSLLSELVSLVSRIAAGQ